MPVAEPWFFLHIPKCAGTTFIHLLDQHFVNEEIFPEHDRFLNLQHYTDEEIRRYPWIRGHFPYEVLLPRLNKQPFLLTFLRDPVDMFLSHVGMRLRLYYPEEELSERLRGRSLEEVLEDDEALAYFNNFATKMLGGTFPPARPNEDPSRVWSVVNPDLEKALSRLHAFDFVGLVERFDDALYLLSTQLGFPPIRTYHLANVSPLRRRRQDLDEALVRRIEEINALDMALYREAMRLFEQRWQKRPILTEPPQTLTRVEDDLHRVFPGQGWYPGERHPVHGVIRWTGPEPESRLYYPLRGDKSRWVRVEVINWAAPELLEQLSVWVNGIAVEARRRPFATEAGQGWVVEAFVPQHAWRRHGRQEIALRVPRTVHLADDKRRLGVCVRRVTID